MKLFAKLDKSWQFLLGITLLFFFLRLPSLFEPYWYGDEGIYQTMARSINSGRILFSEVWDNKPPLLYLLYALYDGNQFSIRLVSLLFGLASLTVLFFLSQKLFTNQKAVFVSTAVFALLFGLPFIEGNIANAENFFVLPVLVGIYLLVQYISSPARTRLSKDSFSTKNLSSSLFIIGIIFGLAFLFKTVTVFDFAAGLLIFLLLNTQNISFLQLLQTTIAKKVNILHLILGFLLPFVISIIYFFFTGALGEYVSASFLGNVGYVGYNNAFIIPQGLLLIKGVLLALNLFIIILVRNRLPLGLTIILLWLSFSVFSVFFSQRPYPHYVLALVPVFSLFIGSIFEYVVFRKILFVICAVLIYLLCTVFRFPAYYLLFTLPLLYLGVRGLLYNSLYKKYAIPITGVLFFIVLYISQARFHYNPFSYYGNFLAYTIGAKSQTDYFNYFDSNTTTWYEIAEYIKSHTSPNDSIFLWSNVPQIYYLSETLPPGKYVVGYHIAYNKKAEEETKHDLLRNPPKYILISDDIPYYPFSLTNYSYKVSIGDTDIYEKVY